MRVIFLDTCKYGGRRVFGLLLLGSSLAGCALPASPPPKPATPSAGQSARQPPIRAIIYFRGPTVENEQLRSAISAACNCQPVFFRRYRADALIYEIALLQDETFATFTKRLMSKSVPLGIEAVEQDRIMRIQK